PCCELWAGDEELVPWILLVEDIEVRAERQDVRVRVRILDGFEQRATIGERSFHGHSDLRPAAQGGLRVASTPVEAAEPEHLEGVAQRARAGLVESDAE